MNLNCLSCKFMHGNKSDSDCGEHDTDKSGRRLFNIKAEGISWSGYLYIPLSIPPPYKKIRSNTTRSTKMKVKTGHCQKHKSGPLEFKSSNDEPRLVRSRGMRRDWSFENLRRGWEEREKIRITYLNISLLLIFLFLVNLLGFRIVYLFIYFLRRRCSFLF